MTVTGTPAVRAVEAGDADRVREVAERSMTASYPLSPREIEAIADGEFGESALREKVEASDAPMFVAELDDDVVGFVEGSVSGDDATVRWLHVAPERRGRGVGTTLLDRVVSDLHDRVPGAVRAVVVAANPEGGEFLERSGFRRTGDREVEVGGRPFVADVYTDDLAAGATERASAPTAADPPGGSGGPESAPTDRDRPNFPDEVTTAEGEDLFLGDELLSGTDGPFAGTYADADRTEERGYYCGNCGSTDVSMDSMERLRCADCGNAHRPDEGYDGSYL